MICMIEGIHSSATGVFTCQDNAFFFQRFQLFFCFYGYVCIPLDC